MQLHAGEVYTLLDTLLGEVFVFDQIESQFAMLFPFLSASLKQFECFCYGF